MRYSDEEYIATDPFFGEEAEVSCRTVKIRIAAKEHACFGLDGTQHHTIAKGQRYRHERALVDSDYWGEYRICLPCMDKHISDED